MQNIIKLTRTAEELSATDCKGYFFNCRALYTHSRTGPTGN